MARVDKASAKVLTVQAHARAMETHSLTRLLAPRAGFLVAYNVEPAKKVEQKDATR